MNLADLPLDERRRWRIERGQVPGCDVGTIVTLSRNGPLLAVARPWFGVVASLDLRTAPASITEDLQQINLNTASGAVLLRSAEVIAAPSGANVARPDGSLLIGQVVQFGAKVRNAEGWNLFVFLVLRRVNGWLLGLTQAGHPAGIAEDNIAWIRVIDPGPHSPPNQVVLTYQGGREACDRAFESALPTLRELGYKPIVHSFQESPSGSMPGVLTVTLDRLQPSPAAAWAPPVG